MLGLLHRFAHEYQRLVVVVVVVVVCVCVCVRERERVVRLCV